MSDNTFSNGKWAINVRTVGDAIRELSFLDPGIELNQDYENNGCDIVVMNRSTDIHVCFSEGGYWDDTFPKDDDDEPE